MTELKAKKDDLIEFVNQNIINLAGISNKLTAYGEYLRKEFYGKNIVDTQDTLKKIILGGINKSGIAENSLSKFYIEYFGVGLTNENVQRYINSNGNLQAQKNIAISFDGEGRDIDDLNKKSMFYHIKKISDFCNALIARVSAKGFNITYNRDNYDENMYLDLVEHPNNVVSLIRDFYNYSLRVLPTYNGFSMFLKSITVISERYAIEAYPDLKNNLNYLLMLLDGEIKPILNLNIEYIEFILPIKNGLLSNIINLQNEIFSLSVFAKHNSESLFNGIEDEWWKYLNNSYTSIKEMLDDNARKIIRNKTTTLNIDEKGFVNKFDFNFPNFSLSEVLKSILPLRFAGCISIGGSFNNSLEIINHLHGVITP
jgi:hypothetical protein